MPAEIASARTCGSSLTATMFSRRSLASLPSSLKLIRLVAMREPGGTTTMTSSSVTRADATDRAGDLVVDLEVADSHQQRGITAQIRDHG